MQAKVKRKKPVNKKRVLFILSCIAIPIINWLISYVYVNFSSFSMAFTNRAGEFSLDNFIRFFDEFSKPSSSLNEAFRNTFLTFGLKLITFPFQVLVSYFIYKKIPFHRFYRNVFFLPSIILSVATSLVFAQLIGVDGFIAQTLQKWLHLDYIPELLADSQFANATVLGQMLWFGFPGSLIIWGGAFARIPVEVLESAKVDGVNWWTEFTKIIVPLVWPTVALQMVLMFSAIFSSSGNVFLLTGGQYGTMTFSVWMYLELLYNSGNKYSSNVYNYMSAVGLVITVIAITISLIVRKITDKMNAEVEY